MASQSIRAIYNDGRLRLLDPVDLTEGQEIRLVILTEQDRVHAALADILVQVPDHNGEEIDEEALQREIDEELRGQPPLSETIIQERREGP